jgi:hypothetical protein
MALKKYTTIGLLFFLFILPLLWGCPYESECPLGKVSTAVIDQGLIGKWQHTGEGEQFTMIIQQFNDHELLIMGIEGGEVQPEAMRAFITVIEDEQFLNLQEIKETYDTRGWYLVKYSVSGATLTAWSVDGALFTKPLTSTRALYRFVRQNLQNKALYCSDSPMVFQRVGE